MPCHLHPRSLNCAESLAFLCDEALLEALGHLRQTFVHRGRRIDLLAESRGKSLDDATMPAELQPSCLSATRKLTHYPPDTFGVEVQPNVSRRNFRITLRFCRAIPPDSVSELDLD